MTGIYIVDAEYIKPDTPFTRGHSFKLKKKKINEKYQATILHQQDFNS